MVALKTPSEVVSPSFGAKCWNEIFKQDQWVRDPVLSNQRSVSRRPKSDRGRGSRETPWLAREYSVRLQHSNTFFGCTSTAGSD
mmetsp:Transcript_21484/g.31978  ORF Transcript_21484/g.31978 Transcript_21484/m.31978 type:complete len:84 (-) Transcript_21484:22-273(-)